MITHTKAYFLLPVLCTLLLTGCQEDRVANAQAQMDAIRAKPPLPVPPAPTFTPVANYAYSSGRLKSPFVPASVANELRVMAGRRVYPNLSRPLQPLETYALEELVMKGTLKTSGKIVALIKTPDGQIEQIRRGNYMGKNHGRVTSITADRVSLVEIVPDGQDGYIERPRIIVLHGTVE